jgi:GT2 family glycosyltransferase
VKKNNKDITVIITLYKTPIKKLYTLIQYKNFKNIIFNQESNSYFKKKLKIILGYEFRYYFSQKNIGLSKASNFLLSKVNTKFCLFTQADVIIEENEIKKLEKILTKKKNVIFVAPNFKTKSNNKLQKYSYVKKLDIACVLVDVKKLKKIGFFDEDFFLYWEDIYLIDKINKSNYKMIVANNIKAYHDSSSSTLKNLSIKFIRDSNFKYGELLYDYKLFKLRQIKIIRQLLQNLFFLLIGVFFFKRKKYLVNLANIYGILKFLMFLIYKKIFFL